MPALDAFAYDRQSVRSYDRDGRLRVAVSNISRACVSSYYGAEIPNAAPLGLDPTKIYALWRHPAELARAAPTFNSVPLLARHIPVSADDHRPDDVVGATGSDAAFRSPFLQSSLIVWAAASIRSVEDGSCRELSASYRYIADPTPGVTPQGERYDLVMRDIVGNHLALVPAGRCGSDVLVADGFASVERRRSFEEMFPTPKGLHL